MQTALPKVAAILLAISAVAFMGLSVAAYYGRPNPIAEMGSPEVIDYKFEASAGETTTWTVTPSVGTDKQPKQFSNAYAAVLHAFEQKNTRLSAETTEMNVLTETLRTQVTQVRVDQQADMDALAKQIAQLDQLVKNADGQLLLRSQELQKLSVDTLEIRQDTTKRREDVTRLQSELDELRTSRFALNENIRVLTDELLRLQLENQDLDRRLQQMKLQLAQ